MPLYEYKCDNCGKVFEAIQKYVDPELTSHEECGGGPVHRLISAPTFNFKGSGFYITDYAKGSAPGSNAPARKGESASSSEGGKSDSGSATPTPAAAAASDTKSSASASTSSSDKK